MRTGPGTSPDPLCMLELPAYYSTRMGSSIPFS